MNPDDKGPHEDYRIRLIAVSAAIAAGLAWVVYASQDLVLSHYDAKAHLVVARRVLDSITPGWQQLGAVWLPLPHLINLLPVQVDLFYRTGAFASLVSVACFGITAWAAARLVVAVTGSQVGAVTCAALLLLNPNLLYLHATPMTEPIAMAAALLVVLWLHEWVSAATTASVSELPRIPAKLGLVLFLAAWTRYEAWLVTFAAITAAGCALWRHGLGPRRMPLAVLRLAIWPATAVILFLVHSRATTGSWFVTGGFYEIDPYYHRLLGRSLVAVWWGTHQLSGYVIETVAIVAAAILADRAFRHRPANLVPVALFAAAALPFYAFFEGHPFRVRYMAPLVAACAVFGGIAVGLAWRLDPSSLARARGSASVPPAASGRPRQYSPTATGRPGLNGPATVLAILLITSSLIESPPWNARAPLLVEAQWDVPRSVERRQVTACLSGYDGERIFASMSSLAHYMQELSNEGFAIADFVHEGNGPLWLDGLQHGAARHAGWMLVEEQSEGGDALTRRIQADAEFARGMRRVCEGGGVALYRRDPPLATTGRTSDQP